MEYEILEAAFAKAGKELQETRLELDEARSLSASLEAQAEADSAETEALRGQLASYEALAEASEASEAATRARDADAAARLAELHAALRCAKDELRLERQISQAVREQVDASEASRRAYEAQHASDRRRLAAAGLLTPEEAADERAAAEERSGAEWSVGESGGIGEDGVGLAGVSRRWDELLRARVSALELAVSSRDAELAATRESLEVSRAHAARLFRGKAPNLIASGIFISRE